MSIVIINSLGLRITIPVKSIRLSLVKKVDRFLQKTEILREIWLDLNFGKVNIFLWIK